MSPKRVDTLSELAIDTLALGESHSAAMNDVGQLYCWGEDSGEISASQPLCINYPLSRFVSASQPLCLGPEHLSSVWFQSYCSHSHTLTITCTCCYDVINGIQDLKIYSHADSLSASVPQPLSHCASAS